MNWKGGGCQWVGATGSDEVGMSVDTGSNIEFRDWNPEHRRVKPLVR